MSWHELALQKALIAHLSEDVAVQALLGDPARIWDAAPREGELPHLLIGRCESRLVGADGGGVEHRGTEEAKAVLAAVRLRLTDARVQADGVRAVSLGVVFADVFPAADGARTYAVLRVRAVTEEVEP
jgi:hypothetical protein